MRKTAHSQILKLKKADLSFLSALGNSNLSENTMALFDLDKSCDMNYPVSLCAAGFIIVQSGRIDLELDLKPYTLKEKSAIVGLPGQIGIVKYISDDFSAYCFACSEDYFNNLSYNVEHPVHLMLKIKDVPFIQLNDKEYERLLTSYKFIKQKIKTTEKNICQGQILKYALISLIYEYVGVLQKQEVVHRFISKKEKLFNDFIELVAAHHREKHEVKFYAAELFITPKYLSVVTEEISRKSAKRWIDEYLILDAKVMLSSSDTDVKRIADSLNFPDASFFGKFFRRMENMTPKEFKNRR